MTTGNSRDFGARRTWSVILAVIALGLVAAGYGFYRVSAQRIRLDKYNELSAIGKLKAYQIAQWRQERLDDVIKDAENPFFRKAVEALLKDSGNLALRDESRNLLMLEQTRGGYCDALLLDVDGRILLAAKDAPDPVDAAMVKAVAHARDGKKAILSDLFPCSDGDANLDAVAAVLDANNRPIAVLILRSDATKSFYSLVQSWPILSRSAETLIVRKEGDDVLFLNELRHQAGTALSLRIPLTRSDVPAVQAVLGRRGMFEGKDYRGVKVLADLKPVPDSPWFMVAKVDASEILAEVNYRAWTGTVFVALFVLLATAAAAFFYRQRQVRIYRDLYVSEREKRQTQELLRATLIGIGDGVISTDEHGRVAFINPIAETLTGWPQAEAHGRPLTEVFHIVNAQTREHCENPVDKVLARGETVGLANDAVLVARDGTERQIADSGAPIRDTEGGILGVVLVFRDVSEEYRMRQALAASEVRYRRLFESAKDGILILDAETGVVIDVNPFLVELLGHSREQLLGKRVWELGSFGDILVNRDRFLELQQHEYIRYEDLPLKTADGCRIDVEFVSNVYPVNDHNVIQCNIRDITERKRAEMEVKSARDYITNIVNAIGDPVFVKDDRHRFALVNDAECALIGCPRAELIGKTDADFFPPEQVQVFWEMDDEVLSTDRENVNEELITDVRTGETRTIVTRKTRYVDPRGNRFVVGVTSDITERKRAEEKLRALSSRQEALLAAVPEIIMEVDNDKAYTWANQAGIEFFGENVIGKEAAFYFEGEQSIYSEVQPLFNGDDRVIHVESLQRRKDGQKRLLAWCCRVLKDESGNVVGALSSAHDITERRRAEEAAAHFSNQLTALHSVSNELSRVDTLDDLCRQAVELGRSRLGFSRLGIWFCDRPVQKGEGVGSWMRGSFGTSTTGETTDERNMHRQIFETSAGIIREGGERLRYAQAEPLRDGQGEQVGVGAHASALLWDGTAVVGLITADDLLNPGSLTERQAELLALFSATVGHLCSRKRAEQEREKLEAQLRQALKMEAVGQLAGGIAHDFNNLLQVILGYVDVLQGNLGKDAATGEALDAVRQAGERAADLTRQLLAFSRRQIIKPVNVDLNRLLQGVLKMIRRVIGEHIAIRFMPAEQLGTIYVDRGQMEQIVTNLSLNARDAMPNGGTLTIETEDVFVGDDFCREHPWAAEGRYALMSVTDTGHGMDEATRAQVFEPFFTTKGVGEGTGLGLATVYGIVKQHNGLIHVYSEPEKGTAFKVYIPIVERPAEAVRAKPEEAAVGGTETILVAEDEEVVRNLVSRILETAGYTVLTACDGEEALRVFEEHAGAIDMAILDVMMPKLSGRDAMNRIQQFVKSRQTVAKCPRMRFLFSSGYSQDAIHTNFVIKEGLRLITKPYGRSDLLRAVRETLEAS